MKRKNENVEDVECFKFPLIYTHYNPQALSDVKLNISQMSLAMFL